MKSRKRATRFSAAAMGLALALAAATPASATIATQGYGGLYINCPSTMHARVAFFTNYGGQIRFTGSDFSMKTFPFSSTTKGRSLSYISPFPGQSLWELNLYAPEWKPFAVSTSCVV